MPNTAFLIFLYFTEWLIVYTYANRIYEKRNRFSLAISVCLYAVLMLTYKYLTSAEVFNVLFSVACHISCLLFCFKSKLKSALFYGTALSITQYISEVVSTYIVTYMSSTPTDSYTDDEMIYMTIFVICRLVWVILCRLLLLFTVKEQAYSNRGKYFSLSIMPASSIFIIVVMRSLTNGMLFTSEQSILCIVSITVLLIANILVYIIYEKAEKDNRERIELELINQKNEIDMKQLELLEIKNDKMNIMAHDYKNHLMTLSSMSDSQEVKDYINSLMGDITKYTSIAKTKNKLLDVILGKYTDMCSDNDVHFEINISEDNFSFISGYDMAAMFNNLLDNAFEAATNSKEKYITVDINKVIGSYHKLVITNSSDTEPQVQNSRLITTKKDKEAHGFGSRSVKKVVRKYKGEIKHLYDCEKKEFKITVLFPLKEEK